MGKKKDKNKIAGINIGNKLGPGEIKEIAAKTDKSVAQILNKAENKGISLSVPAQNYAASVTPGAQTMPGSLPDPVSGGGSLPDPVSGGGGGGTYEDFLINNLEYAAGMQSAELRTRSSISNYGWDAQKAMENIRQAAETERLKYEVDNRIPVVQAESKGRIDLQKIINAGEQNITRIQRGADMVRSITSMFNF